MKPDEFWRLTPAELNDLAEGYKERSEIEMTRLAWHAANVMNVHLKKKVTIRKLLGKEKVLSFETREQQFNKLMELMNQQKGAI